MSVPDIRTCAFCREDYENCDCCPDSRFCSTECAIEGAGCECGNPPTYHRGHPVEELVARERREQ